MSNHRVFLQPKHYMSLPQPQTVAVVLNHYPQDDEDDNDICPVCDGECTCSNNNPRPSMSMNDHEVYQHVCPPQPQPQKPTLTIKLTVPKRMLAKRRAAQNSSTIEEEDGYSSSSNVPSVAPPAPKRRGRPPKSSYTAAKRKNAFIRQKNAPARARLTKDKQAAAAIKRKVAAKRHQAVETDDDDNESDTFPTFVSASALSSLSSSDSDSSTSSDFDDAESDIEAEEERYIIAQVRDKARARRELLGDEGHKKRDYHHDNWVIRPRKKSVSPSDGDMDLNSDATEDDDDQSDDDDEEDVDENDTDSRIPGRGYVGLATSWSGDEESSFDADLFFANLTGSDNDSISSASADEHQSEQSVDVTDLLPHLRRGLENLPFEVAESWDGQIVFTNGLHDGQGVLDIDFEIEAAQFMADLSHSAPTSGPDTDVEMLHSDDGGYEEDADGADGDTTDEELVGEDDLPNERAMRLFNLPLSVSAINPMSTVSPGPRHRWQPEPKGPLDSPRPADILAGRVYWDSDPEDVEDASQRSSPSKGVGPKRGSFVFNTGTRNAIIDDSHQEVPSPHPAFRRNKFKLDSNPFQLALMASSPVVKRPSSFVTSEDNGSLPPGTPDPNRIELNDVLDASVLDPDPPGFPCSSTVASDSDAMGFHRWDLVSVGAFRQTREIGTPVTDGLSGWRSDPPTDNITDYGKAIKPSPTDTMFWQNRTNGNNPRRPRGGRRALDKMMDISPVILPRDGDRTPTNVHSNGDQQHQTQKSRKELRRERKLKRKSAGPVQYHKYRHQNAHLQHYQHHHYPNMKSRSAASVQRANFVSSSVPPLSL